MLLTDHTTNPEQFTISRRNMGIFYMVLNYLGVPDHLHEFVIGTYLAGSWNTNEMEEISLMKMARSISHDNKTQLKVYNRLKKNSPKFFDWQAKQTFTIIERILIHEHTTHHKTKAKYRFLLGALIRRLFNLPVELSAAAIRRTVDRVMTQYPSIQSPTRKRNPKRPESVAKAVHKNIDILIELTGSRQAAILYLAEASPDGELMAWIGKEYSYGMVDNVKSEAVFSAVNPLVSTPADSLRIFKVKRSPDLVESLPQPKSTLKEGGLERKTCITHKMMQLKSLTICRKIYDTAANYDVAMMRCKHGLYPTSHT